MKRLILSLGILVSAIAPKAALAQVSPCLNDLTPPTVTWNVGDVGKTLANPVIIKLSPVGYAAIVADSGNGTAGINKAKVAVPAQFTQSGAALFTIVDAEDACALTYTGSQAAKWPKFTISKGAFVCADVNASKVTPLAITYNVFDEANNVSTGTIYVRVVETVKPTITTKPATLTLSATGTATLVESDVVLAKNDNCGAPTVTLSKTGFTCTDLGSNTVYVKVTDASGNKDSATAVVTVVDATAPSVTLKNATLSLDANGSVTAVTSDVVATSSDACDLNPVVVITPHSFDCSDLGANTVTVTVTDASGNQFSGTTTIDVEDNAAPVVTPQNITVSLDASGNVSVDGDDFVVIGSDNCDVPTYSVTPSSFTCDDLGVNNVTFKASDASGNYYTTTLTVTVVDDMDPTLSVQNVTLSLDANGNATLTEADAVVSKGDNCSTPVITFTQSSFDCSDVGNVNVDVTATDAEGNLTVQGIVVTIEDNTNPIVNLLSGPFSFSLAADGTVSIDETDLTSSITDICTIATVTVSPNSFDCTDIGSNTVTITATDDNGNVTTETVSVSIVDDMAPVLTVTPFTVNISNNIGVGITNTAIILASDVASATDNCGTPTITLSQSSFDCSETGANTITVTATDDEGNVSTETVVVTVVDNSAPVLTKLVYERDLANGFAILSVQDVLSEIAADNCAVDYSTSALSREYFDCEDVGSNTVTASIFDFSGNFSFVNFTVIIHDTVAPIANAKQSHTIYLDANGNASVTAADVDNGSSDDCNNFTLSLSQTSFDCDDLGSNTVTFTISDEEVNSATASVNIIVSDTIRPVWNFPVVSGPISYRDSRNHPLFCEQVINTIYPDSWNIGDLRLVGKFVPVPNQAIPVTLIDFQGNSWHYPWDTFFPEDAYVKISQKIGGVWIEDLFQQLHWVTGNNIGDCTDDFSIRFTTSDSVKVELVAAGNYFNECGIYVSSPVVYGPLPDTTVYLDQNGSASIDASALYGSYASDNCDFAVTSNQTTFTCTDIAASPVTITLTATDDAGNTRNTTAVITVLDTLSPVIDIASAYDIYLDANGQATLEFADIDNGTADNCTQFSDLSVVLSKTAFDCGSILPPVAPGGQPYTVNVTVTDLEGNDRTVSLVVTVHDTLAPVASVDTVSYTAVLDINGTFSLNLVNIPPSLVSFTDNCGVDMGFFAVGSTLNYDCDDAGDTITVTLVAVDEAGNETEVFINVTVEDQDAPVWNVGIPVVMPGLLPINDPTATVSLDTNGQATLNAQLEFASYVTDNCDFKVTSSVVDFDCLDAENSPIQVMLTATDSSGNASTQIAYITVEDNIAPTQIVLSTYTATLDANGLVSVDFSDIDSGSFDNCDFKAVPSSWTYDCDDIGSVLLTGSLIDSSGNSTPFSVNVTVEDKSAPVFDALFVPANVTVYAVQYDCFGLVNVDTDPLPSVTDNCDINVDIARHWSGKIASGIIPMPVGLHTLWAVATDDYGNTDSTAYAYVQVIDTTLPDATFWNNVTVVLGSNGTANITPATIIDASYDNCGIENIIISPNVVDCDDLGGGLVATPAGGIGYVTLTVTLVDFNGNTRTYNPSVAVEDQSVPTFVPLAGAATVSLNASGSANVVWTDLVSSVTDNCSVATVTLSQSSFDCTDVGVNNIVVTATDPSGNVATFTAVLNVVDDMSPLFATKDITLALNNSGNATIVPTDVIDVASLDDNCSGTFNYLLSKSFFDCTNVGVNTVNVTVSDMSGNATTFAALVTIVDDINPTLTLANGFVTVSLDANGQATLGVSEVVGLAADNCSIQSVGLSQAAFDCTDLGNGTVTVTATDVNGNSTATTQNIVVVDLVAPVVTVKSTPTVKQLDATGAAIISQSDILTSVTDNCTVAPSVVWSPASVSCAQVGPVTVSITVTDASGNVTTTTKVIQVVDELAPSLATKSYTAVLNANGNATVVESNVVSSKSDNCGVPVVSMSKTVFDCTNKGVNNVLVTASDVNGNATSQVAVVTVVDQTAPSMVLAGSLTVSLNGAGTATISVPDVVTAAEDNCDVPTVTLSKYTYTCADMPSTSITVTAVDAAGNSTVETFTVNVVDALAPVITTKSTTTTIALDANGSAPVVFADVLTSVFDNCTASPTITWFPTAVTCAQVGPVTVSITTTDASGNVSVASKVIQVVDNINPTLVTKAYTAVLNANGNATVVESNVVQSKSDNCGVPVVLMSKTEFDCTNKGANNVTVTATDANGNITTQTAVVTVVDQTAPFFTTAPSLTLLLNASGTATISVPSVVTSSGDNCDIPTVTLSKYTFTCSDMPSTSITITAVDASGNTTTGTYTVNVLDQLAPVITPKSTPTTIALDATGNAAVTLADVMGVAVDNCTANPVVSWFPTSVSCAQVGSVTVYITATDASGNFSNSTKVIQVVDNINPTLVTKAYTAVLNTNGNATVVESNVVQSKSDNCGIPAVLMSKTEFDCTNKGANNVTVTATDANGNITTQTAVVTVVDQTAPFFTTAPSLTLLLNANGVATVSVPDVVTSSGDNCDVVVTLSKYTFTCSDMPSTSITVTAVDGSGNTTTGLFTVNVLDQLAPVITPKSTPTTIALDATGNAAVTLADVMGLALDNCTATPVVTWFPTSVSCAQVGPVTVTITAVDASGNVSNATKVIQIIDNIAPTVVLNGNSLVTYTLPLNATGNATLTVPNVVNSATDNCGTPVVSLSKTAFDCSNLGDNVVVVTAVDQFGNVKTTNAIVKVVDVTAPSIVTPSTQVVLNLSSNGTAILPLSQVMLSTTDNCGTPTVTWSPSTFSCTNLGNNTVTITSMDASGNVTTATVVVLIQDVTAPVIATVSGAVTKVLGANGTVAITQADVVSSVSDACTNPVTVTWTPTTVSCANVGNVAVVVTAIDASGNVTTAVKTVLVVDQTAPVISSPASITLNLNAAGTVTLPAGVASATDNCAVNGIQYSKSLFDCSNLGANTVTITATDVNGNVATSTMTVNVVDNTAPSLTLVASPLTVALNAAGSASVNAAQLVANANDNCAIASYTVTPNTFNCSSLGGNTVTVTATDASGNATSQTVTVNVVDVTGPSIVVNPAAVTVTLNANGVGSITNAQVVSSVSDNCTTAPSVVITPNVFTCADLGQQMVTIFATDAAGNISTTTKLITVVDASAPVIVSAPQNVTLPGCNGNFTYAYQVTDNCGYTATLVSGLASGTQFPVGTTTVTWSFADASGNTTTHSFNVTVLPLGSYTLPAVNEYCAGHGQFDLTAGQTGLVFYGSSVFNNGTTFYTEVPGIYALNFVFTDANGCTQNGTFNLIVRPRPAKPSIVQVAATTLESSVTGATYQWYRNEQPIVGAKNKQYVFTAGGKYEVVVFNAYGCGTMSEGFVINANGLSVEEIITSVRLFPNPTSSSVTLETSFEAAEDLQVTLVDMIGSVVYRGTLNKGNNQHVLDMSGLAAGTYNVILTNANGASSNVQRVVKID